MSKMSELLLMAKDAKPDRDKPVKASDIFDETFALPSNDRTVGWTAGKERREKAKITKPVADWNQKDILKFIGHLYYETTGQSFSYTWGADYGAIRDIASRLNIQFKQTECSNDMMRDFLTYTFQKFVTAHIGRGKKFWTGFLAQPQHIIDFAKSRQLHTVETIQTDAPIRIVEEIVQVDENVLTMAKLDAAFKINARYFVTHYGAILHANYLMLVKGQPLDVVILTIQKAIDKAESNAEVITTTNQYGPYPSWLPFTDVSVLKLSWLTDINVCADNRLLGFLKPRSN